MSQPIAVAPGSTIAFVVPRYGPEILGGAETLLRGLAEQLHQHGYSVLVLTTCSDSINVWNNQYPPGPTSANGVPVLRFLVDDVDFHAYERIIGRTMTVDKLSYAEEKIFIENSINSQPLYAYLREHAADFKAVILGPYLFGTTYFGAKAVPGKAIILPCFHDEVFARFSIFGEMVAEALGMIYNTTTEQTLVNEGLGYYNLHQRVVGYGFTLDQGDAARFRARHGLGDQLLVYSGRFDSAKNVPLLLEYFERYQAERQSSVELVLCGFGDVAVPDHPNITAVGRLGGTDLLDAYAAATALCQPSVNESFSIVIMESWIQGRPVLVHRDCEVTYEHVQKSAGGLAFRTYAEFAAALDQFFVTRTEVVAMGQRGRSYVTTNYSWPAVAARLIAALDHFTQPLNVFEQLERQALRHALNFSQARYHDHLTTLLSQIAQDHPIQPSAIAPALLRDLEASARIGAPSYQPQSRLPGLGRLITWLRRNLTSHLREPYLDPIVARQEQHNQDLIAALLEALSQSQARQARQERRVQRLEQQLAALQRRAEPSVARSAALRAEEHHV